MRRLVLLACLAILTLPATAGQVYQWKDAQGRTVFSDRPPPSHVRGVAQKTIRPSVVESGESWASRQAREKHPVVLYASDCGAPCDSARALLATRGVPHRSVDPFASPEAEAELKALAGNIAVPVLLVGQERIDGFGESRWQAALDRAGYPRARAAAPAGPAPQPATSSAR